MRLRVLGRVFLAILLLSLVGIAATAFFLMRALEPKGGKRGYIRVDRPTRRLVVLQEAEAKGYIRSARAVDFFATLARRPATIRVGTYRLSGEEDGMQNYRALGKPISQMFRFPETNWAKRSANLLEKAEVCPAGGLPGRGRPSRRAQDGLPPPQGHPGGLPLPRHLRPPAAPGREGRRRAPTRRVPEKGLGAAGPPQEPPPNPHPRLARRVGDGDGEGSGR